MILIVAPAGYGKTTAIRQLLQRYENPVFISTPPTATTIDRFIHAFASDCSQRFPAMSSPPNEVAPGDHDAEHRVQLFSAWALAHLGNANCVIAIDDLQYTDRDPRIAEFLVRLAEACKGSIQWIFSSRTYGHLPRTRWQAYGDIDAVITAHDLRMTLNEAHDLAVALRCPAGREQLSNWVEQTRGFPVPLAYAIRLSASRDSVVGIMDETRTITFHFLADCLWKSLSLDDRALLELSSLIPSIHIHDYERVGITDAGARIARLCNDIAFLTVSPNGLFSIHDLFREFMKQQLTLGGEAAYQQLCQVAIDLLLHSRRYVDSLELLIEIGDVKGVSDAIERVPIRLDNLAITPKLIEITGRAAPESLQLRCLSLQTDFWLQAGAASKALRYAEEILKRTDASSRDLLHAIRVISGLTHFQSANGHKIWLSRMARLIERLDPRDYVQAIAYQANFCARYSELRSDAMRLVQDILLGMDGLDSSELFDTLLVTIVTFFCLSDINMALQLSRKAVALAQEVDDPRSTVKALNTLGVMLYNALDSEYESVSAASQAIVEKSGAWRFSQSSHWLPATYYARLGDAERARTASVFQGAVILADETQRKWLTYYRRLSTILCYLIDENYGAVITDFSRSGTPDNIDGAYNIAVIVALANAFLGDASEATTHLARAKSLREGEATPWEQRGILEILYGEVVALCLVGRWAQARRVAVLHSGSSGSSEALGQAVLLFCDGPPFVGVLEALEPCFGRPYIGLIALLVKRAVEKLSIRPPATILTAAEADILRMIGLGKSNKDIASSRSRSTETIKRQVASLYKKLGVENRTSAVAVGRERGLL